MIVTFNGDICLYCREDYIAGADSRVNQNRIPKGDGVVTQTAGYIWHITPAGKGIAISR